MTDRTAKVDITETALEDLRDAIAFLKPSSPEITLTAALTRGAQLVITELRIYCNSGRPFPKRNGNVPKTRHKKKPALVVVDPDAESEAKNPER